MAWFLQSTSKYLPFFFAKLQKHISLGLKLENGFGKQEEENGLI